MRIFVSGVAGFMGSHLADGLLSQGHKVTGIDNLSGGSLINLPKMPNSMFHFYQVDLNNYSAVEEVFREQRPEIVYHCSANAREGASFYDPCRIVRDNIYVSSIVIELGIKYGMKKLVFTSSMATFGKGKVPFGEKQARNPVDVYGLVKWSTEEMIKMLAGAHEFYWTILLPHNIFGERQRFDPYRNFIAICMNRIMRKEPIYIYGKDHVRAFSYIDDCLPALVKAAEPRVADFETICVGGKEAVKIIEAAEEVIKNFPEYPRPEIIELPSRHGEVVEAYTTYGKSIEILDYKERYGWKKGVEKMSEWAKKIGPFEWGYETLPLLNESAPSTWKDKV